MPRFIRPLLLLALSLCTLPQAALSAEEQPTRAELAALTVIMMARQLEFEPYLETLLFDYSPGRGVITEGELDDGTLVSVRGSKSDDGTITELSKIVVSSPDNPLASAITELDQAGRPLRIQSPLGTIVFDYSRTGRVKITTTTNAGITTSYEVAQPPASADASVPVAASADSTVKACSLELAFGHEQKTGQAVFACDVNYSDDTDSGFRPLSMSAEFYPDYPDAQPKPLQLSLDFLDKNNDPANSVHSYQYTVEVPTRAPSYQDWVNCCEKLIENPLLLYLDRTTATVLDSAITELTDIAGDVALAATCAAALLSGGAATPACVTAIALDVSKSSAKAVGKAVAEKTAARKICATEMYQRQKQQWNPAAMKSVTVGFSSDATNGYGAVQVLNEIEKVNFAQGDNAPDLFFKGSPTTIYDVSAFDADGKALSISDGVVNEFVRAGEKLSFRVFDEFYDRSKPNAQSKRRGTQHYGCGRYTWTLKKDGTPLEDYMQQGESVVFDTEDLAPGEYTMEVSVNSNTRGSYLIENGSQETSWPLEKQQLTFTVVGECLVDLGSDGYTRLNCRNDLGAPTRYEFHFRPDDAYHIIDYILSDDASTYVALNRLVWKENSRWYSKEYSVGAYPVFVESTEGQEDPDWFEGSFTYSKKVFPTGDQYTYNEEGIDCNGVFGPGRYVRKSVGGAQVEYQRSVAEQGECPTRATIDAINPLRKEDSLLYMCEQSGKRPQECFPLKP